jgi:hypothetical protein
MIIGLLGNIGSGKGFASDYIQEKYGFTHLSFAESLKKAISNIFGWEYELLKGSTKESREWREVVDVWWSNRLGIPNLTPRKVLQLWGTEVCRNHFHQDIWIASLERKLNRFSDENIIIDDCRFTNEITALRNSNAKLIQIRRGSLPEWYDTAKRELEHLNETGEMRIKYPNIHISEWGWILEDFDHTIHNDSSKEDFEKAIDKIIRVSLI